MRLRLPFFCLFLLSMVCLFLVRYQSFRTFEVRHCSACLFCTRENVTHHSSAALCVILQMCSGQQHVVCVATASQGRLDAADPLIWYLCRWVRHLPACSQQCARAQPCHMSHAR